MELRLAYAVACSGLRDSGCDVSRPLLCSAALFFDSRPFFVDDLVQEFALGESTVGRKLQDNFVHFVKRDVAGTERRSDMRVDGNDGPRESNAGNRDEA